MIVYLIITILIIYSFYTIFPTYILKLLFKLKKRNYYNNKYIYLTFDDGPDIRYTNKLLDLLKKYNIKSTFFIVANKAEKSPEIISRMKEEGHIIGIHSLEHKNSWFKGYFYTRNDFKESMKIIQKFNLNIKYFRPPWGLINIFTILFKNKYNLNIIFWDVMAQDWEKNTSSDIIFNKLIKRTEKNSIICLHDSGEGSGGAPGAPLKMIEALEKFIPYMIERGYIFVNINKGFD